MPLITITGPRRHPGGRRHRAKHPKARIVTDGGLKLVLPYAPREGSTSGLARVFTALDRPGRKPLLVDSGAGLRVETFTVFLGYRDHQRSIEPLLHTLRQIARSGDRCTLSLSRSTAGVSWRLTDVSISVQLRQEGSNDATRATADLTFTEASDAAVKIGPLSGGKKAHHGHHQGHDQGGGHGGKNTAQHYTVRSGDTLSAIALKFYDDPNDWHRIAKANHITDPRKLRVGQRLIIPADK